MNTKIIPAVGQRIVVLTPYTHDWERDSSVVGGGEVIAVEPHGSVTVAQPYVWRQNGVIVERGTTPTRFQIITHTFEIVEA